MEQTVGQGAGSSRLVLKDFINLAIFSVIYFVGMFVVGMPLGFLVLLYLTFPFFASFFLGIPSMFFLAKAPKPFALFLFAAIPGTLMTLMGHTPIVMIHALVVAIIAEIVRKFLGYKTIKGSVLGYATMSTHFAGPFWQIFLFTDMYRALTESMMGKEYASQLLSLPIWIMPILYVTSFIGGILGGFLGAKILKKHFVKAGLV